MLREHGTERPGSCALLQEKRAGTFRCVGVRAAALRRRPQVRERHRLAELLRAARGGDRQHRRSQLRHEAHRGALQPLRRSPRPRLRGRSAADRAALLHQRRRARRSSPRDPELIAGSSPSSRSSDRSRSWTGRRVDAGRGLDVRSMPCAAARSIGALRRLAAAAAPRAGPRFPRSRARSRPPSWMNVDDLVQLARDRGTCRAPRHTSTTVPDSRPKLMRFIILPQRTHGR